MTGVQNADCVVSKAVGVLQEHSLVSQCRRKDTKSFRAFSCVVHDNDKAPSIRFLWQVLIQPDEHGLACAVHFRIAGKCRTRPIWSNLIKARSYESRKCTGDNARLLSIPRELCAFPVEQRLQYGIITFQYQCKVKESLLPLPRECTKVHL